MATVILDGITVDAPSVSADRLEELRTIFLSKTKMLTVTTAVPYKTGLKEFIETNVGGSPFYVPPQIANSVPEHEVRRVFTRAKERLIQKGWAKTWVDDQGHICLGTALGMRNTDGQAQTVAEHVAIHRAVALLGADVPHWNDDPETNLENVIAVLDVLILTSLTMEAEKAGVTL